MSAARTKLQILIADDDAEDRMLISDALRESKYRDHISQVENGEELIDFLHQETKRPDLILLDLNMPKKDGREALKEIKTDELLKNIPVVILTTSNSEDDIEITYSLGGNSYITKPSGFHDMVEIMENVCRYWFKISELPNKAG